MLMTLYTHSHLPYYDRAGSVIVTIFSLLLCIRTAGEMLNAEWNGLSGVLIAWMCVQKNRI